MSEKAGTGHNRPYEDETGQHKPYGLVFDFVGIFDNLEKALAFDSDVVASVIQNIDVLKKLFETMIQTNAQKYLPFAKGWGDKAKEKAIEHFKDKEDREEFFRFFRELQNIYDIITPDAFLRPFMEDYQALAELYALIREAYSIKPYVDRELTAKTKELLQKYTRGKNFQLPGEIHELGPKELAALRDDGSSDITKTLNLNKVIAGIVDKQGQSKPYLVNIGERAEALSQAYENRQIATQEALAEFIKLAQEYIEADEERKNLKVDENTFAIYTTLKPIIKSPEPEQAIEIDDLFRQHPDYEWNEQESSKLRTALYKALIKIVGPKKYIEIANTLLRLKRV